MLKLIVLGSAHSIPDEQHENTHLALVGKDHQILIDALAQTDWATAYADAESPLPGA